MKQTSADGFLQSRRPSWTELSELLVSTKPLSARPPETISRIALLYREVCTDRMRAERLALGPSTLHYLDSLISRGHAALYDSNVRRITRWGAYLWQDFPRALRHNRALFGLACALFFVPYTLTLLQTYGSPDAASEILPVEMLEQMAEAYRSEPTGKSGGQNATMAGFYVYNNVGIAFRCFATGILFGLGSAFFLIYNGAITGAVTGHVIRSGGGLNILTFVAGHAPLELTAIAIAGAAGLQMGRALVVTGGRTRLASVWNERNRILPQVVGAMVMLLLAAAVEAFWSPSSNAGHVKWAVGVAMLLLVISFLAFAGRRIRP